jgi:hypothetical protein
MGAAKLLLERLAVLAPASSSPSLQRDTMAAQHSINQESVLGSRSWCPR